VPLSLLPALFFVFEMQEPRLRIVIPDVPEMKMQAHPDAKRLPHARFLGAEAGYTLSVLTPAADAGATPGECARSGSRGVISRFGLDPKFVVGFQADERTFVMLFPYRVDPVIQFKAFLLSADQGKHCVEVHVSRTMAPATEQALAEALARWYQGFRDARIESY